MSVAGNDSTRSEPSSGQDGRPGGERPVPSPGEGTPEAPGPGTFWERVQASFEGHRLGVLVVGATAVVGLLGAGAALVFTFFPDLQPKPGRAPDVRIENVAVGRSEELHGQVEVVPGARPEKQDFPAPVLDVLLVNSGEDTAYVKSAEFTFFAALDMNRCSRTGGGNIDHVTFPVEVPVDVKPGDRLKRPVFFKVDPHKGESLAFTLGPAGEVASGSWLYGFSLTLKVGSASVTVPKSAVSNVPLWKDVVLRGAATLAGSGLAEEERERDRKCYAATLRTVQQVLDDAAHVPAGLEEFALQLEALLQA
ncbi:hypothetical protein SUDANB108_00868 [Streptomyces sp. enrichment culture]|uniref:hypothetical protein n=1 Tax=Streptomyces sp. enrichment culture TaxID=1795815 RepID=UPI003F546A69